MHRLVDQPLLTLGQDSWSYGDAVLLGLLTGTWTFFEARVRAGLALEAAGEEVADEQLEAALVAFRRERRLLALDDLKTWMAERELESADIAACVRRALLRERVGTRSAELVRAHRPEPSAVAACLRAEALCSGVIADCAAELVARAAAERALDHPLIPVDERLHAALVSAAVAGPDRGLRSLGTEKLAARAEAVLRLDAAHRRFVAKSATDERLERHLVARRLDLTRVRFDEITLATDAAAREATLCVRIDGMALPQVAARAEVACCARDTEVGTLDGPLRAGLASGRPGDLVGPVPGREDGYTVAFVRDRRAPSLDDRSVRRRLTEEVVRRQLERHAAGRVEWHGSV